MNAAPEILSATEIRRHWRQACEHHLRSSVSRETGDEDVSREAISTFPQVPLPSELLDHDPGEACFERLEHYARLTLEANSRLNLVSRKNPAGQILVNILDSLPLACLWPAIAGGTGSVARRHLDQVSHETGDGLVSRETSHPPAFLLDAGSGSGVPGIPVWLFLRSLPGPEAAPGLFLLESRAAKAEFLSGLLESMQISEGAVHHGRLEGPELPVRLDELYPESSGLLCARALTSVDRTLRWSQRIRDKVSGAIFIKGAPGLDREWREERSRWAKRGWRPSGIFRFQDTGRSSYLLCVEAE